MDISLSGHYGYRRLAKSALPSIGMVLITSVYSMVDGFFVSRFVGKTGFAAINLVWPAIMMLAALGQMVGSGGAALVAKVKGEGYAGKANRIFTMLVRFSVVVGTLSGLLFGIFAPAIARWLGADGPMMHDCVVYSRVCMVGMPFFALQMAFQSYYMAAERPQLGTVMSLVCGVTNILLDALFVWLLQWGVAGAAWSTVVSQVVGGAFPLVYFSSRRLNRGSLRLLRGTRTLWPYVGKACSNGLSEYVSSISMSIVSICYNLQLMRLYGEDGVAAYGILMYISFAYAAVFIGYNLALTPIIGYHYGAGDVGEQRSLLRKSLVVIGAVGLVMTLTSELLSAPLARLFIGYDAALAALTTRAIRIYMLCFLICGWSMFASALFTGLQNGLVSAVAAFARSMVFELGCVWLLPALAGPDGIWWAVDVAELLTLLLCAALLLRFAPHLLRRK
ncbi:MAG: polysaccharide biosynthesis C-terminal domain-containing protein [Bacteroidales bacterium]|nr:polysaccharide biosynthesis C-terminal domain-containing protein [Bacteroidales bacterium]